MANIKSQIKRIRTAAKAGERNKAALSALKTYGKKVRMSVKEGNKEAAEQALKEAVKALDSAAVKGVIHRNNASNKKSSLTKAVNSIA